MKYRHVSVVKYVLFLSILILISSTDIFGQSQEALDNFSKGQKDYSQQKYVGASVYFTDAIAIDPNYTDAYEARGLCWYGMGNTDYAIKDFRKALELNQGKMTPKYYLLQIFKYLKQNQKAVEITELMMKFNPENLTAALNDRSILYESMGKIELAIADCNKIISLNDPELSELVSLAKKRLIKLEAK